MNLTISSKLSECRFFSLLSNLFSLTSFSLAQHIRIDKHVKLLPEDAATLTALPMEVREKSASKIVQYILDLKKSAPVALHRTKLMVVGYEKVGKTSLLENIFPFVTTHPVTHDGNEVKLEIKGKDLLIHSSTQKEFNLGDGKWSVFTNLSSSFLWSSWLHVLAWLFSWYFQLVSLFLNTSTATTIVELRHDTPPNEHLVFTIEDEKERGEIVKRLKRICGDETTHGIDIQRQVIPIPSPSSSHDRGETETT